MSVELRGHLCSLVVHHLLPFAPLRIALLPSGFTQSFWYWALGHLSQPRAPRSWCAASCAAPSTFSYQLYGFSASLQLCSHNWWLHHLRQRWMTWWNDSLSLSSSWVLRWSSISTQASLQFLSGLSLSFVFARRYSRVPSLAQLPTQLASSAQGPSRRLSLSATLHAGD